VVSRLTGVLFRLSKVILRLTRVPYSVVQSTIGKKMVAVHFTTIPCKPNTACKTQRKPNFYNICLCTKDIVYARFEDFVTLLCVFMNIVKAFAR